MISLTELGNVVAALGRLPALEDKLAALRRKYHELERRMATQEEFRAQIDSITTALGDDVMTLAEEQSDFRNQIAELKRQLDAGNTQAVSDALDALSPNVEGLRSVATQLHNLAAPGAGIPAQPDPLPEPGSGDNTTPGNDGGEIPG